MQLKFIGVKIRPHSRVCSDLFHFILLSLFPPTALNGKLSEFRATNGTTITFTPKCDCNALVTYEADGWGYGGGLWQLDVNAVSTVKPTKSATKRAVFHGHDGTNSYAKGWSYFTGLKAGTAYTFKREAYAGSGGGENNAIMTVQTLQ